MWFERVYARSRLNQILVPGCGSYGLQGIVNIPCHGNDGMGRLATVQTLRARAWRESVTRPQGDEASGSAQAHAECLWEAKEGQRRCDCTEHGDDDEGARRAK